MCIAFPGKIVSIDDDNMAVVDIEGTRRSVCLDLLDETAGIGDYVISHAGFALHKVDESLAQDRLALLKDLLNDEAP